jgi:glycyl-tRNA synthetase beta chain
MYGGIEDVSPLEARRTLEALSQITGSGELADLATLFKRVKNIAKGISFTAGWPALVSYADTQSQEPAERALVHHVASSVDEIERANVDGDYLAALKRIGGFQPFVAKYFDDVMVMTDDQAIRDTRLQLMAGLRELVLAIADISEIAAETSSTN